MHVLRNVYTLQNQNLAYFFAGIFVSLVATFLSIKLALCVDSNKVTYHPPLVGPI